MGKFIFKLLKMMVFLAIGVPLLFVILNFIDSADVSLTQTNIDENLSVEEQIANLELQVEKEKLQAKNDWEQIVRKASREGNANKNRVLTSNFVDLNTIQTDPIEILTETEKTLLNRRLQGNIVRFNGYIEKSLIPETDELFYTNRDNYEKTGVIAKTTHFHIWDFEYSEAVYCTFGIFDESSKKNYLKLGQNPEDKNLIPFTIKGDFVSISHHVWTSYERHTHKINLTNCQVIN